MLPSERRPGRPRTWESEAERKRAYRQRRAAELAEPLAVRVDAQQARAEAAAARTEAEAARRDAAAWTARAAAAEARVETASARAATASLAAKKARGERDVARRLLMSKLQWARDPGVLHGDPAAMLALVADLYKELSARRRELSDPVARTGALRQAMRIDTTTTPAHDAGKVVEAMADESSEGVVLSFPDGRSVSLPASLVELVRSTAGELAGGRAVTVLSADTMLTPAEAAELLGLSRPFVVRLLDDGVIPSERLPRSRHRRVLLADVLGFAAQREQRRQGRRQIGDAIADAGLPY